MTVYGVEKPLVDARRAAELCGVDYSAWEEMLLAGACPAPEHLGDGGVALWDADQLKQWLAAGRPQGWQWHLIRCCPWEWTAERQAAYAARLSSSMEKVFARFEGAPLEQHGCDRCKPDYICEGCAREVNRHLACPKYMAGWLDDDNPAEVDTSATAVVVDEDRVITSFSAIVLARRDEEGPIPF
jgi:hypothetical protein